MTGSQNGFADRLATLWRELAAQGRLVAQVFESACEAVFALDSEAARAVVAADDEVDRADVLIEQACVAVLSDATQNGAGLTPEQLRGILTIVKINNELERTADCATAIAMQVALLGESCSEVPPTFRVLTNSVAGILRDVVKSFERKDPAVARIVLASEDAVESFKSQLLRDAERRVAAGSMEVDLAFCLHELANQCERIADHATNIAEQVIYSVSGAIVRHTEAGWVDVPRADS